MEYYWGLIKRNLIQPEEGYSVTGYRCTLHDVVRSFAEYMAREEMLVVRDEQAADGSGLVRRLSIAPRAVSVPDWVILKKQKSLRTLALRSNIKLMPGDSLTGFSSLRVLYIVRTNSDRLVDSLCDLKHLRFLHLNKTNISRLPDSIHNMKFLQFIMLIDCKKLASLPSGIVKLVHLRYLDISGSNVSTVPKGFFGLTNLRSLYGFPVHVDDIDHASSTTSSWCSLQELAPLSQLRQLTLHGLEKVPASRMAEKAFISSKGNLSYLWLNYNSVAGGEAEQQRQKSVNQEEVLEKLYSPTSSLENLSVRGGYAGGQLPN
jgi:Leucine-rich repeat (LRR) protein